MKTAKKVERRRQPKMLEVIYIAAAMIICAAIGVPFVNFFFGKE